MIDMSSIIKRRGWIMALFIVAGSAVAWKHESAAAAIFASMIVPVGAFASFESWASTKSSTTSGE